MHTVPLFLSSPSLALLTALTSLSSFGPEEKNQARIEADRMDRETKRKTMQQRCGELFDEMDMRLGLFLPESATQNPQIQILL